jgi:hypothetical protein
VPSTKSTIGGLIERLESLLGQNAAQTSSGSGLANGIGSAFDKAIADGDNRDLVSSLSGGVLGGGAGLIAGLLRSLFGGESDAEPVLPSYEKPGALFFEYDVNEMRRTAAQSRTAEEPERPSEQASGNVNQANSPSPTVIVQVNALDAQSFSSRSDDIASAVREALARNHALRDEIWED